MEAWVTSAKDDAEVKNALVLGVSLRRAQTRKKLVVQVAPWISQAFRKKLEETFDLIINIPKDEIKDAKGFGVEASMKLKAMTLKLFHKVVYITPTAVVLKNCDDIFEQHEIFAARNNNDDETVNTDVFLVSPSEVTILTDVPSGTCPASAFEAWLASLVTSGKLGLLNGNGISKLTRSGDSNRLRGFWGDLRIVTFERGEHPLKLENDDEVEISPEWKIVINLCRLLGQNLNQPPQVALKSYSEEPIAIVGLSFRLPGGNTPEDFWKLLVNGEEAIRPVPENRWRPEQTGIHDYDRSMEAGFLNCGVDEVDGRFFGWSSAELEYIDPQQRLLHECTWEALEDAGMEPSKLHGSRAGIFVGTWAYYYSQICSQVPDLNRLRCYLGNSVASTAARLSHFLGTTGPSIGFEQGCSTSITALHSACSSLRQRESEVAIVGGANLILGPFGYTTLDLVLSKDGRCKTFDASADGFGRAEGVVVFVLKRLSDARRNNDKIWGLIRGSAVTQEGVSKSLGTPTVHTESLAMELALKAAGVHPSEVSLVEAHGTGTAVGDPIEVAAIRRAYSCPERTQPLLVGSVKTNIGHTEAVSGLAGMVKVLLAMKEGMIPPHRNFTRLNPEINLEAIPAEIPLVPVSWPRDNKKARFVGVSSFGISGGDAHVILEEPPEPIISEPFNVSETKRPLHLLKLSAKTSEALDQVVERYSTFLESEVVVRGGIDFENICYSANTGRATFSHRAVILASDIQNALKILKEKSFLRSEVPVTSTPLCFLFTGQGSQYPGMARTLYATSTIFKAEFDHCCSLLLKRYNINLKHVIWSDATSLLNRTLYSQTAIFCVEYCLLQLWLSWGVKPDFVLGHSLGEFCAAVAASALTFEDALMLVAERSRLIDSLPPGKMLVIKTNLKSVEKLIESFKNENDDFWVDFAAINSEEQTVVAGDSERVESFAKFCNENNLKTIVLAASHAFHSRHMEPMLEAYRKVVAGVKLPKIKENGPQYISGMEGRLIGVETMDSDYWVRHTREPVRFLEACKVLEVEGCELFLEVGPHPVLSALTIGNLSGNKIVCLPSLRRQTNEWTTMLDSLGKLYLSTWGGTIDWKGFDLEYHRTKVDLPKYPWQRKSVWTTPVCQPQKIHPLLGSPVPSAVEGVTIFQNELTLTRAPYVGDHVIGSTVIFPGAGFLEMCLFGGWIASTHEMTSQLKLPPQKAMVIKGLTISAPLALYPSKFTTVQTVVALDRDDSGSGGGYTISVSSRTNPVEPSITGAWVTHVKATFLPIIDSSSLRPMLSQVPSFDIQKMEEISRKEDTHEMYEHLASIDLHFGSIFRSLSLIWKNPQSNTNQAVFLLKPGQIETKGHLIHPVIGDAMLQALVLMKATEMKKLMVPVRIEDFMWLADIDISTRLFVQTWEENGKGHSVLVEESGKILAYVGNVDFVETTAKAVEDATSSESLKVMPQLWQEIWRSSPGPLENSLDLTSTSSLVQLEAGEREELEVLNVISEEDKRFLQIANEHSALFVLRALLRDLHWVPPKVGKVFEVKDIMNELHLDSKHLKYLNFFFVEFERYGWVSSVGMNSGGSSFVWRKDSPSLEEVEQKLLQTPEHISTSLEYAKIAEVAHELGEVLQGKKTGLSVVFPEDPKKISVSSFYRKVFAKFKAPVEYRLEVLLKRLLERSDSDRPKMLRVLEVGAGTGTFTSVVLNAWKKLDGTDALKMEYHFTDISAAFFGPAEDKLRVEIGNKNVEVVFAKFDMDFDPLHQGYSPDYFDLVIACEVLHVGRDLSNALRNIRTLLKPRGVAFVLESIKPNNGVFLSFGLLDGYWHFEDERTRGPLLSGRRWEEKLTEADFEEARCHPVTRNEHGMITALKSDTETGLEEPPEFSWIIFDSAAKSETVSVLGAKLKTKLEKVKRSVHICKRPEVDAEEEGVRSHIYEAITLAHSGDADCLEGVLYLWSMTPDNLRDQRMISLPLVTLLQSLAQLKEPPKVVVITQGACDLDGVSLVTNPSAATTAAIIRGFWNEMPSVTAIHVDLSPEGTTSTLDSQENAVFHSLWSSKSEHIAFRFEQSQSSNLHRFVPKLVSGKIPHHEPLTLPSGCDRFKLAIPTSKLISDLEFTHLEDNPQPLGDDEVEIEVKSVALNFRDIFVVIKPIPYFDTLNNAGLDLSGVVSTVGSKVTRWKPGDSVIGFNTHNITLPSHLRLKANSLVRLPPKWSWWEGCTLPVVFCTAYYSLFEMGKVTPGETVLIHTASGGVGICAIQLCQRLKVNVVATAGSERKRNFLRTRFGLSNVFNSRSTSFFKKILEVTGGKGVDLVLNSLTGPGFKEATLQALAVGGRFIEMSKLDVWTKDEVEKLRGDVNYALVDLDDLEEVRFQPLMEKLEEWIEKDWLQPLPFERFDALNIRGALNHLRSAQHIGKVVCVMPEVRRDIRSGHLKVITPLFTPNSTYLVTGGLSGIGFEVIKYILANGGRYVAIATRRSVSSSLQLEEKVKALNERACVRAFSVDVGKMNEVKNLLEELSKSDFPPLRGVFHCAGLLSDGILSNQNWTKFEVPYGPKIDGSWHLHDVTKESRLECFVVFSSFAARLTFVGQMNHGAANAFEDALIAHRHASGLPGTSVNWGNWGEVGVATEVEFPGVRPITTAQGFRALDTFLRTQTRSMGVFNVSNFEPLKQLAPFLQNYVEDKRFFGQGLGGGSNDRVKTSSEQVLKQLAEAGNDTNKKISVILKLIEQTLAALLRLDSTSGFDPHVDFMAQGADSLVMLEMKNHLQNGFGSVTLTPTDLKNCTTPYLLAEHLLHALEKNEKRNIIE